MMSDSRHEARPIRRVSLVYPPYGVSKNEPGVKTVKEHYGVFPSLSLLYVAGVLEQLGVEVQFIDANAHNLSIEETAGRLEEFRPDLIGYTITTYLFYQTLDWVRRIKERVHAPTMLGGVHMGIYPRETMTHDVIDYGVTAEAEEALPPFFEAMNGKGSLRDVPGLCFRENGEVTINSNSHLLKDVNRAPFPARHLVDNTLYYSFISRHKNFTPMITSRGCPFRCIFCEQGSKPFRPRSPENVLEEMEECVGTFGVREFDFFDSSFTSQEKRVLQICEGIKERKIKSYWAFRSRVDLVTERMLKALRGTGCMRIYYGIESGDSTILKTLRKETNLAKIEQTIKLTRKAGIDTFGYFMFGSPGETPETIDRTISFSLKLGLTYAQYSKVTPMPATALYEMIMAEKGRDFWSEYVLDESKDIYMPRIGTDLSEDDIQAFVRKAYLRFYARPQYILKALTRVRSLQEVKKSAAAFFGMIAETLQARDFTKARHAAPDPAAPRGEERCSTTSATKG